jgi:hypothetical protein
LGADQPCSRQVERTARKALDEAEADLIQLRKALERAVKKRNDSRLRMIRGWQLALRPR